MSLYAWTLVPLLLIHLWFFKRNKGVFQFQLLLDVILAVVVGPALVVGGDLNPVETIKGSPPFRHVEWSTVTGFQPTQGDLVYQFHPWWEETGRQLRLLEHERTFHFIVARAAHQQEQRDDQDEVTESHDVPYVLYRPSIAR